MATETWFGGDGHFRVANNWLPPKVPASGDTALIGTGTAHLTGGTLNGVTIDLQGLSQATEPVLALKNVWLGSTIESIGPPPGNGAFGEVSVSGLVVSTGNMLIGAGPPTEPAHVTVTLGNFSALVNTGTISANDSSQLTVTGPEFTSLFVNEGTVKAASEFTVFDVPVAGHGTFQIGPAVPAAALTFGEEVGKGVTVNFAGGNFNTLQLDEPMRFLGTITGFGNGTEIDLPKTVVTSESFANNQLKLFHHAQLVARLHVVGKFTSDEFVLTARNGGTAITFNPMPTATMPTGIIPAGTMASDMFAPPLMPAPVHG